MCSPSAARDGKGGRDRHLEGAPPRAVGSGGLPGARDEEPSEMVEGAVQSWGSGGKGGSPLPSRPPRPASPAPPRLRPRRSRPSTLPRARWRRLRCPSSCLTSPPRPSRLGPRVRGGGMLRALPPRPPRLRPWRRPRVPSPRPRTARRGSSGRVSRAVRRDGWRLPVAGPLALPRRLLPLALDRSVVGRPLLWAYCGVTRRLPTPS